MKNVRIRRFAVLLLILSGGIAVPILFSRPYAAGTPCERKTQNVILLTFDGLRWQEVFGGADKKMMNVEYGKVDNLDELNKLYWRETPEERRELLMPFFWKVIAKQGQLFGNQKKGSKAQVTNKLHFSYPGYQEILAGFPDSRIISNGKMPNPNVTVLEWLNNMEKYKGHVAVFGSWDVFPFILNRERAGFFVNAGWEAVVNGNVKGGKFTKKQKELDELMAKTKRHWEGCRHDDLTFPSALEYFKMRKPRVFYIAFGDTDEWGHEGEYDNYLNAANQTDSFIKALWDALQSMKEYKGKTTIILTTDHGRGTLPTNWTGHSAFTKGSKDIWIAVIGPDTKALGERENLDTVTQAQVAATLTSFLGEDYNAAQLYAGKPIVDALPSCP